MTRISKSRLLATSAIVGLSIVNIGSPAIAQEAFGIHNDQPERLEIEVGDGEVVEGDLIGIYADNGPVTVGNAGTIRGNGIDLGGPESRPSGGIVIAQPGSIVTNAGEISGEANGVVTSLFFSEDENGDDLPPQALAANTQVSNSGLIRGNAGSGVALAGGGSVTNGGTISGFGGNGGNGATGIGVSISEFPGAIAADVTGVGTITNNDGGVIEGQVFGAVLQGGGTVTNMGTIRSLGNPNPATPGVSPFGLILGATTEQTGRVATVVNTGTISGFLGVLAGGALESATINNDGTISAAAIAIIGQSTGSLTVNNFENGEILANATAITSNDGQLTVDNQGFIFSAGQHAINITTADAVINNSQGIVGALSGITTNVFQNAEGTLVRAKNTAVTNSGTIEGRAGAGVALTGGGTVVNSGVIRGLNGNSSSGTGVVLSEFAQSIAEGVTGIGSVTNAPGGLIEGQMFGVVLQGGGTVDNAGIIRSTGTFNPANPNVSPFGVILGATSEQTGRIGTLNNSGTVQGFLGVLAGGSLSDAVIENEGLISGQAAAIIGQSTGVLTINNHDDGEIVANGTAIRSNEGSLIVDNAGLIRGDAQDAIVVTTADAVIVNSGTISGGQYGIVTTPTAGGVGRAVNTSITNSGEIIGNGNDAIRLAGGGTVTNSGLIEGVNPGAQGTDGISMFAHVDQSNEDYAALVTNETDGRITGQRFGVILSGGGDVSNAGEIEGVNGGVYIQGTALNTDPNEDRSGLTASVVNTGDIRGTGNLGGSGGDGYGVGFGSDMSSATLDNSGTIRSDFGAGVSQGSRADVTITNAEDGTITGGTSGIYSFATGTLVVNNAGVIRGQGSYDGFDAAPDAGVTITTASSSVTNSGTISGAGAGITTAYQFDEAVGDIVGVAIGTQVTNSGTILGESNDGVRLIGGGTVTNSGTIRGEGSALADGISIYPYDGQALAGYAGAVANSETGAISGTRFGIIMSAGGTVDNAGTITGEGPGGVLIQRGSGLVQETGYEGTLTNTGTITGTNGYGAVVLVTDTAAITNSGTIVGATSGSVVEGLQVAADIAQTGTISNSGTITGNGSFGAAVAGFFDTAEIVNSGTIAGATDGVILGNFGTATLVNTGAITGGNRGVWGDDSGAVVLDNAGTITGEGGIAVQLGSFDDSVTLRTGSAISGLVDAGAGTDSLTLDGDVLELTEAQQLTEASGFETLNVVAGYWSTSGAVGAFDSVTIDEGAALRVNEIEVGGEASSPILTPSVRTNGLLVLNFGADETVSALDDLTIDGTGQLQLVGDAVFTVDTANIAHTGGTIISNGGLVLTGLLQGDVKTEGTGFFELGAGGTEGSFSGNIVNDGRFVFNRSDDYDFLGAFSGSGVLDKMGDGALTFMGDYAFQGVTNILGGSVRIGGTIDPGTEFDLGEGGTLDITGKDQTIGGLEGDAGSNVVIGDSQLTVAQSGNTSFGGDISGTGSLVKEGEGTLNLTGDSSYTGPTSVNGGTLAVNGSIASPVTVNSGGTLGGNGTVGSTTVGDGGTLAPGNSIGQLTVNGDLAFAAGSTYEVEVNAAGAADRLDATGAVTIASTANVAVLAEDGDYNPRTDYVILTGATGITGTFGSVTTDLAFLDPLLRYSTNSVTLSLYRNDIDFADIAVGFNQASVATAVQALGVDNPLYEAVLVQNAATAQASFGDLSGEILASAISGLTDDGRHLRNALVGMKAPEEGGAFVWGSAFGGWGEFDANRGNFAMDTDHKGLVAGFGFGGNGFAAALSAGIGGSDFRFGGRGDHADVESKYLAAHATYGAEGGLRGTIGVSYAWHKIDTTRAIGIAGLAQTLTSKRDADTLQIFGEIGYDIVTGNMALTPFARLAHVDTGSDAFAETGGNAALTVAKGDQKTTFVSLGGRAQFNAGQPGFQPYVSAAWNRALDDRGAPVVSRFTAGGPAFAIVGAAIPKNSAEVEAGFEFTTGPFRLGAAYTGTLASDRNTHGARVTARIAF
jgi:fibronectin-binding autotransporter adhesin